MREASIDINSKTEIMTVEEVAQYLRMSTSWVYKNWQELGGRKLGGSLFFPGKENLYERLFCKRQGMEVRLHPQGDQVHRNLVQNQSQGKNRRGVKKKGAEQPRTGTGSPNRHGLLGPGKSKT